MRGQKAPIQISRGPYVMAAAQMTPSPEHGGFALLGKAGVMRCFARLHGHQRATSSRRDAPVPASGRDA